ncbi:hypothetical protein [Actinomadura sp. HBU206391]|uniref:hypothetical protein n=1 Tax=Actinomadura sp. HBU206391 TaxID=2731692 RepID=UPI00164FAFBB|nr:hypothetical protein [Actinomadura sp. HBU206391]MBC6461396.1 hypothetical protein [Actinomadura sp. HBU206391]
MVGYDSYFLQSSATGQFKRLDVITDGGNFLALRHYVQGNGMPDIWEVVDNTWADVSVGTPSAGQGMGLVVRRTSAQQRDR